MYRLLLFVFLLSALVFGQSLKAQQYAIKKYGVADGLGQSQVQAITQDSLGYLWIGTLGGGISRFDGTTFENFTKKDGLASNFVLSFAFSEAGELLIGTAYGLSKISGDSISSNFTNSPLDTLKIQQINLPYIATNDGIFTFKDGLITKVETETKSCSQHINQLLRYKNSLWAATNKGLLVLDNKDLQCRTDLNKVHNNVFSSLIEDQKGNLWLGSYGGGLTVFDNEGNRMNYSKSNGLNTYDVLCLFKDSKNQIWIGSGGQGVSKFDGKNFTQITHENGLSNDFVRCIFEDKAGNVWFGTSNGLSKFEGERFVLYDQTSFMPKGGVYSFFQSTDSAYWAGTLGGGLFRFKGEKKDFFSGSNGFTNSNVKKIYQAADSTVWIGTDGRGFFSYKKNQFRNANVGNLWIRDIQESLRDSCLYLASLGQGLIKYKNNESTNIQVSTHPKSNRVNQLIVANEVVWLATDYGGYFYNNDSVYSIKGLPKERFTSLVNRPNGTVFFGNIGKGIFILKDGKVTNWTESKGLSSDNIYGLLIDGNKLWVGTEKGLDVLELDEKNQILSIQRHSAETGFMGIEIIRNCLFKDFNHNFWFGTVNGLVKYDPSFTKNITNDKVLLKSIELFYNPLVESAVSGQRVALENIVFEYDQNHFTFRFLGISTSGSKLEYRWRLIGLDDIWSPATIQSFATYANLPSGKFSFEVQTRTKGENWSDTAYQNIEIKQPFWQTAWFRFTAIALALILFGLVVWLIIRYSTKKNRTQLEKQETKRRIVELEQQALRLQMNPHFLFNSLNAIKGAVAKQETKEAKRAIDQFAKLMRSMLENTQEGFVLLSKEIALIEQYLSLELLNHSFDYEIKVSKEVSEGAFVPAMMIQPMIENAVLHGISPLKMGGKIWVNISLYAKDLLLCEIKDNGVGREASKKAKENSIHKSESRAMHIIESRLALIKAPNSEAKIEIIDLDNGMGKGTLVQLFLPLKLEL